MKHLVTQGNPLEIELLDRKFGGTRTMLLSVDDETGVMTIKDLVVTGTFDAASLELSGDVAVDDLTVADDAAVGGDLAVTGSATAADLIATDDLTVGGDAAVTGSATAADLIATDDLTVGGDAAVTGGATVGGTLGVTGLTTLGTSQLNGDATLATGTDLVLATAGAGTKIGTGATQLLGLWGATAVVQHSAVGEGTGFTVVGSSAIVAPESTFTGNTGTKAYTIGDIVKALKLAGIMAAS